MIMDTLPRPAQERLGETLRFHREEQGMTQTEVAVDANLTRGYLSQLESGLHSPSLHTVRQLSLALDVELFKLIRDAAL